MTEINGLCTHAYWNGLFVRLLYGIPAIVRTVRGEDRVEDASIIESINDNRLWKEYFSKKGRNNLTPQKKKQLRVMMDSKECRTVFKDIAAEKHEFSVPVKRFVGKSNGKRKRAVYTFNDYETMALRLIAYKARIYDHLFSDNLYSFRARIGIKKAISDLKEKPITRMYGFKTDIKDYFNTIDADMMLEDLKGSLDDEPLYRLFEKILKDDRATLKGKLIREKKGVMAGVPVAPFLSNVYLKDVDAHFAKEDCIYMRYADDIILLADTEDEVKKHYWALKKMVEDRKLRLSHGKEKYYKPGDIIEFLGYIFTDDPESENGVSVQRKESPPIE